MTQPNSDFLPPYSLDLLLEAAVEAGYSWGGSSSMGWQFWHDGGLSLLVLDRPRTHAPDPARALALAVEAERVGD